ncbi:hypothetical protein P7K49_000200 [Saguinus oedipus]|uniref:Uncharacterized protein n=1 Tax=Saguinus oedipus TaxID=9490 RepID=A0ABQ9WB05_SAGOE|nr:hypothetical protein P7K49_000200 [Saguinus oedipus]
MEGRSRGGGGGGGRPGSAEERRGVSGATGGPGLLEPAAPGTLLLLSREHRPAWAPLAPCAVESPGGRRFLPRPALTSAHPGFAHPGLARPQSGASACRAPRLRPRSRPRPPAPRRPGPQGLPHLHARSPRVNPSVQDRDEYPTPVIFRVAAEEGGGSGKGSSVAAQREDTRAASGRRRGRGAGSGRRPPIPACQGAVANHVLPRAGPKYCPGCIQNWRVRFSNLGS